jgi:CheY-like chemotaxis protein/HPt (histidine-containing phosphotransfer) domain-containing protein
MMDGDISVESEYGKGSVFTVRITQKIIDAVPIGEALTRTLKNMTYRDLKMNEASFERIRLPGVSVLVTDDVESNLNVAKGLLSLYGLTVGCARSGEEAIRFCGKKRYGMIFMDQMMAGMDGIEAAKVIRENEKPEDNQFTPIIALTANALIGSEKLFLENGFDGFLAKPLNAEELDKVLRRHFADKTSLSDGNRETTTAEKTKENNFIIEGINPVRGLANCDGDEESYRYILNSFCDDAPNKLDVLKHMIYRLTKNSEAPGEQTLEIIKTVLRTLKNATHSIGAEDLAAYSAKLEETADTNGANALAEDLARFQSMLAETVERIKRALS